MTNHSTMFLFDVDNTLLEHDSVSTDLRRYLENTVGDKSAQRYWELFENLRTTIGYADYLGALQQYRLEHPNSPHVVGISRFLLSYPFAERLLPGSLDVVRHARRLGRAAILSDGDAVFQPHKIHRSGLFDAFEGNVMICVHKERELSAVEARYPADHYVVIDDKLQILWAIKQHWGERVTTVFVRQGHYALDAKNSREYPAADVSLQRIGELLHCNFDNTAKTAQTV